MKSSTCTRHRANIGLTAAAALVAITSGCAATSSAKALRDDNLFGAAPVRIERGRPNALIDGLGWFAGIPNKLALWDRRADNHDVSGKTEAALVEYMIANDLEDVLVRANQYDPIDEWRRLVRNKRLAAGWRYTVGTLNMLEYTLLPGRIVGGDWYNPFTDTINLYSDIPAIALTEAAYAKDVRRRKYPGTYAALKEVPVAGMYHETRATEDVIAYIRARGTPTQQEESLGILYPDYGANWGGQLASFLPYGHLYGRLAGAVVGHTANGARQLISHEQEASRVDAVAKVPARDSIAAPQQDPVPALDRLPPPTAQQTLFTERTSP